MSLSPSANYTGASYLGNIKENWLFQLFNQDSYLSFDATDDKVDCGTTSSAISSITSNITIAFWVNFPASAIGESTNDYIFMSNAIADYWTGFNIYKDSTDKISILVGDAGNNTNYVRIKGDVVVADTWYFVAITSDMDASMATTSNTTILYNNAGTTEAQNSTNAPAVGYSGSGKTMFGVTLKPDPDLFAGVKLKNFAIWNVQLDADNLTAIYNSGNFLSLEEDSGNYDQSSNLKAYWEFNNGENFAQDLTDNVATGTITGAKYGGFLPLAMRDTTVDGVFYHGVVKSSPSIRHSIDVIKSKSKTGNISVNLINAKYQGDDLSAELFLGSNSYYNRTVKVYSQLSEMSDIADCLQLYHGRLTDISHNDSSVKLSIVQKSPWDNKTVPTVKSSRGNYFPIVYGNFTKNASVHGSTTYLETFNKTLFPVQVDRATFFYECLLHKDIGSTDTTLHYYESSPDAFLPVANTNNAEVYDGGYAVKTNWSLKRHIKFKPLFAIKRTFGSDVGNVFDGTANQTISDTYASISMDTASAGTTTNVHKDNNYSIPSFDDPPDITSSSENHGLTIEMRWRMTGFYGTTSNSNGLAVNKVEAYNQSRYATGTLTDTMNDGTIFATEGSTDKVDTATGSGNSTTITEATSISNGAATATEFSAYPYDNGLSIRVKRTVTSQTDGSGGASSAIFGTLDVADVRCIATLRIDRYNSTTDGSARVRSVKELYSGADGLTASWDGDAITLGHEAHRDLLIRYAGMPTIEPENWTVLNADKTSWTIRHWQNKEISLIKYLEKLQYEFGFIHKINPSGKSKYVWIHGTAGNNVFQPADVDVTLSKNDITSLQISTSPVSQILTKTVINTQRHPAKDIYLTETTAINSAPRATYNIKSKENTATINLDALTFAPATAPASTANKQADFSSYYSQVNGDVKKIIECEIVNIQKGYLLETGDIVKFEDMPVDPFADDWADYYMVTDLVRSPGKVKIKLREVG